MYKYIHHILVLNPPVPPDDVENIKILSSTEVTTPSGHSLIVRLQGRKHTVDVISVTAPYELNQNEYRQTLAYIQEHMIATLRLTYDKDADVVRKGDGFMSIAARSNEQCYVYDAKITQPLNTNFRPNIENIMGVFEQNFNDKIVDVLYLIGEAQVSILPQHYKIISLYKALELMMPNNKERGNWLDKYESEFAAKSISNRSFKVTVIALRDRCVHGKLDGRESLSRGDAKYPVIGLGHSTNRNWIDIITLLRNCVADAVREKFNIDIHNERNPP